MFDIPCVILAGGKSSRMGEDKSLLPFKQFNSLIEYQYQKYSKFFTDVYISSKNNKFDFDAKLLLDTGTLHSPMVALKSIFEQLDVNKVFIITVDVPFVKEDTINNILSYSDSYDIIIAKDEKRVHNLCGVFSKSTLNVINSCVEKDIHKIGFLIKNTNFKEILFQDSEQFLNINTQEEYKLSLLEK